MDDLLEGKRLECESVVTMLESPHFSRSMWALGLTVAIRTTSAVLKASRGGNCDVELCARAGNVALKAMLVADPLDIPLAGAALMCLLAER